MVVYLQKPDLDARRVKVAREVAGRVAIYRLLVSQREYAGMDLSDARDGLRRALRDEEARLKAPEGTVLVSCTETQPGIIWVLGENREEIYFGPREGYSGNPGVATR